MPAPDVLVVGGGIIGAACARALAVAGAEVEVVDDSRAGAATPASAGLLAPTVEAKREDPLLGIRVRGRDMYAELAPELHDETGIDPGLWTEGIFRVAFTEADVAKGKADIAWQRQAGMHTDWVPPPELRDRAPGNLHEGPRSPPRSRGRRHRSPGAVGSHSWRAASCARSRPLKEWQNRFSLRIRRPLA